MSQSKHGKIQQAYAGSPLEVAQLNFSDDVLSARRSLAEIGQENQDLENRIKQIQAEKIELEERCRHLEAQNIHLKERHNAFLYQQDQEKKRQPDVNIINEGWERMFNRARQQILNLMTANKQNCADLRTMSYQLQQTQASNQELKGNLEKTEKKKQEMQVKLDEALEKNKEFLQWEEIHKKTQLTLQDLKRKDLQLHEFYNEIKQKTIEVEGEQEKLKKQCLDMQYRLNEMLRKNTKLKELNKEKEAFLLKQNSSIVAQLSQVESERNELKKENTSLKKALQSLKNQVGEPHCLITKDNEILKKQNCEPEELNSPVSEPPPDVDQTSGSWRSCAKRLLKVGLGLATAGLVIPAAYWAFSMLNNSCSPYYPVYGLFESYCHLDNGLEGMIKGGRKTRKYKKVETNLVKKKDTKDRSSQH
ncbi:hypothetical protein ACER0C_009480 [Sarotherodon galilaeus]